MYNGDANYNPTGLTACADPAEAESVLPAPVIAVTKAAAPPTRPVPGGDFTFTVQVSNPSTTTPVTITGLVDNVYGNLFTRAGSNCAAVLNNLTLQPGVVSPTCSFTGPFAGPAGATQTDTVTVTGVQFGITVTASAMATVGLTPVTPLISVTKAASPASRPVPGGDFTFTVTVTNPGTQEPVRIETLVDDVYGDLFTRAGSNCAAVLKNLVLAPGATSPSCSFTGPFTGVAGASQTDTVTVGGHGLTSGLPVSAAAMATVRLTPVTPLISVTKAASPASRPVPGGDFTFTVTVTNPGTQEPVRIDTLVDDVYGDLFTRAGSNCAAVLKNLILATGATSPACTFTGPFAGAAGASQTDTVTVGGTGVSSGLPVAATAMATVTLTSVTPPPVIAVTKAADPPTRPEPGGDFTFTVAVSNPSTTTPVTITSLVDNVYGDLATRPGSTCGAPGGPIGITLLPGASTAPCSFTGPFNGKAGDAQTDTVTVTGTHNGMTVMATAMATVKLTPVGPQIALTKVASPASRVEPGGDFTFTATVSNPSTLEPVTITKLVDNVYGDLATRPGSTCGTLIGAVLPPGGTSAPCSFTGAFSGKAGDAQTDVITVTGMNNGTTVTATAQATVTLTPFSKPAALVAPVNLVTPPACVTKTFKIYVTGLNVARVTYYLDGKRLGTVSKRDAQGRLSFTIRPAPLAKGRLHHLTAVTEPVAHSGQPIRTVRRTFAICAKPTLPRFTG
jgi:hypothetical protein